MRLGTHAPGLLERSYISEKSGWNQRLKKKRYEMTALENPVGKEQGDYWAWRRVQSPSGCVWLQRALAAVVLCPLVSEPERCGWRSGRVLVASGYSLRSQVGKLVKTKGSSGLGEGRAGGWRWWVTYIPRGGRLWEWCPVTPNSEPVSGT